MLKKTIVYPTGFAKPRGAYSPGILLQHAGTRTLYATGQLAVDPSGNVIAPGDATEQSEYVFKLLGEILQAAGMTFDHVVRAQTYLTNMDDFPKFSAVRNRYLGGSMAASTLIEVKGLARPGCCVEIEITAAS
jgi:enamine deaminase RidA (YjgF/YER057c/UK114 family)